LGGTAGAIATCPLEVVKTRLQSSVANFGSAPCRQAPVLFLPRVELHNCATYERFLPVISSEVVSRQPTIGIWRCLK
ncbi:hypothetical protein AVEN_31963-1, partial [Araneus ventricosus]